MPDTLDSILEELVGHYASKDNYGEYWGHDTTCGKGEAISLAHQKIEKLMLSKEELTAIIQLRYFKLMFPDITEDKAKIVANSLSQAIHNSMLKKLKEGGE